MAIGEKYAPLGNWLKEHGGDSVKLTFDELNQIIPIPNHAYKNRPSWANLSNPASFCSSWISAGYVVDSISLEEQWVIFRKGEVQGHTHHSMIGISKRLLLIPVQHPKYSVRNPSEPLATCILTMRMSLKSSGNIAAAELSIRQPKSWTCAFLSMASRETRAAKKTAIRLFCEEGSLWNML